MTGPIEVDYATLHKAAGDVRSAHDDVNGELSKLWGVADDLAAAWLGAASTSFQNLMKRWGDDSKALLTAMNDIADLLDKAGAQHQATDEQGSQTFNKYDSAMGG